MSSKKKGNHTAKVNKPSSSSSPHTPQWERQGEWLTKLRAHKEKLEEQGVQGFDLLEAMATLSLDHKMSIQQNRCQKCWHDKTHCICSQLTPLPLPKINVKLCILMHHKEYLCAGNSAKLLLSLLPNHTELYLFGKQGESDRLFHDISSNKAMILWPGETAISVAEFLSQYQEETPKPTIHMEPPIIHAIVLDGTYTQARNMHKSLRKRWGADQMPVAVAVQPTSSSIFHRAQKNYGKAHLQQAAANEQQVLRVSTAEACGLLLTELGAASSVQAGIFQAVHVNNHSLAFARTAASAQQNKTCPRPATATPTAILQLLPCHTLYDLVDVAFGVCNPRGGETVKDHLWHIALVEEKDVANHNSDDSSTDDELAVKYDSHKAKTTSFGAGELEAFLRKKKAQLRLDYDYGDTSTHIFTLISVDHDPVHGFNRDDFPRRKPEEATATTAFSTTEVDLNARLEALNRWAFDPPTNAREINLFRAGMKRHFGFLEGDRGDGVLRMIYLPDQAESLDHYVKCLNHGALVRNAGGEEPHHNWYSVVVLPKSPTTKKMMKYNGNNQAAFTDCRIVHADDSSTSDNTTDAVVDLSKVFPRLAAFGGFGKAKKNKQQGNTRGWIRYKDNTLMLITGKGGSSGCPQAPKGTSYDGYGFHVPSGDDQVLARVQKNITSIHELFCEAEGLLGGLL